MIPSIDAMRFVILGLRAGYQQHLTNAAVAEIDLQESRATWAKNRAHDILQVITFLEEQLALRQSPKRKAKRK